MNANIKHKRKWVIATGILVSLLLLLPGIIGQIVQSQLNAQFEALQQKPEWETGWWRSKVYNTTPSGTELQLDFKHGPLWINPIGTGITQLDGTLNISGMPVLPLSGHVALNAGYQLTQIIPDSYHRQTNRWHITQSDIQADMQILGSLGNPALQAIINLPQGNLSPGIWQLSWQKLLSTVSLTQPDVPFQAGSIDLHAEQLNWQPLINNAMQHSLGQLDIKLAWPADEDISADVNAAKIEFIGQSQASGQLRFSASAKSIDRIALQQWLNTQQQPGGDTTMEFLAAASLLAAQPELNIELLQLETPEGTIQLQASFRLKPNQREARVSGQMPEQAARWLAKAILVDNLAAAEQVEALINNGLLNRSGDQLVIDLVVNL